MHAAQLFGDGVLWALLLLRQPLDPPDLGKKLTDFLLYVIAILLGNEDTNLQRQVRHPLKSHSHIKPFK